MRSSRTPILLVALATLVRLALAAVAPLFPDETYYWEWSRHLAAGYFDHPPAIAILIRAGTALFGAAPLGVRFGVVLAGAVASWALVVVTRELADHDDVAPEGGALLSPAARTALLTGIIPVALVGFALATPDAPLLATIAVALVALTRAVAAPPRSRASLGWWCAAGVMLGLGFSSKYTAVLLPLGVLVALVSRASLRRRLAEPGPYAATIVALLVFTPTVVWNARHEWISFAFQLHHGLGTPRGSPVGRELDMIGGQLGLVTPILAVMAAIAVARALRRGSDDRRYLLAVIATTVVAFFALSAIRKPVEANWPAPAFVAALPLLALWRPSRASRAWLVAGSALAALVSLVVVLDVTMHVLPLPPRRDPITKAQGWDDLGGGVVRAQRAVPSGCSATWIAADRYQDASELAFHMPAHPRVFSLNLGGRPNQYDLWPHLSQLARPSDCVLLVVGDGAGGAAVVERVHAERAMPLATIDMHWDGVVVARRSVWLLQGIPTETGAGGFTPGANVRAALDSLGGAFAARAPVLDSVVRVFRHGPAPNLVAESAGTAPVSNSDRRTVIAQRVEALRALLAHAGATMVYRDERYRDCTFVRTGVRGGAEIGYVTAPLGCALRTTPRDGRVWSERITGSPPVTVSDTMPHANRHAIAAPLWLTYATPAGM